MVRGGSTASNGTKLSGKPRVSGWKVGVCGGKIFNKGEVDRYTVVFPANRMHVLKSTITESK